MFPFNKKKSIDPDIIIEEKWKTNFSLLAEKRFAIEDTATYGSRIEKGRFCLELKKENLFAWVINPFYRYNNFFLEAELAFNPANPYSAMGFLVRYINDENFYYFLLSNKGYFRFDLVFNGNPIPLLNWTASSLITPELNSLMMIIHGSNFSFYIDDEWVAELADETLPDGRLGFAAQNFAAGASAQFYLNHIVLDSRPVEVEKQYTRWTDHIPVKPENRITLAKTLFTMTNFTAAAIQMKKLVKHKKPEVADCLFFAEILLSLRVYDIALDYIEKALAIDPAREEAVREKANLLYLQNRFLEGRDYTKGIIESYAANPTLWNLLGNYEYALGNWEQAANAYQHAFDLQPEIPLFLVNAARALEMAKQPRQALEKYIAASKLLFRQENYADLYNILPRVTALDPQNRDVKAFTAKMLYHDNKIAEARPVIAELIDADYADSAIYYLAGILQIAGGNRQEAISRLTRACELEPDFYLNWYKLAESRFLAGLDASGELQQALNLKPDYAWSLNLSGQLSRQQGDLAGAVGQFRQAHELAPGELDILLNLSETLALLGATEESFALLDNHNFQDDPRLLNHKGNLYAKTGEYQAAVREYQMALQLDGENPVYMENLAAACIELDLIMKAEELLVKLFDNNPSASVLNLVGNLALIKGEMKRAEIAYTEALKLEPSNVKIRCNLASLYLEQQDYRDARQAVKELLQTDPGSVEVQKLLTKLHRQFETEYACATCSRRWWVPREVPLQLQLKLIDEPPGSAPAGKCPACGKVFCIDCRKEHLREDRFTCPECGEFLKLSEDWLKYILREIMDEKAAAKS